MTYRNTRLNKSIRSLEVLASGRDISKWDALSDRGKTAANLVEMLDYDPQTAAVAERRETRERDQRLKNAIAALTAAGLGYTAPTLLLIAENKGNREKSIEAISAEYGSSKDSARRLYFEHRKKLSRFFC